MKRFGEPTSILQSADELSFAPVNRPRLARYLELPSVAQIDPITDEEIRKLDARRDELLSVRWRAVALPLEKCDGGRMLLSEVGAVEATADFVRQLRAFAADAVIVAAFTLGHRIDDEIKRHLDEQEVYEAFVLKQWAATMAEQARVTVTNSLRCWADGAGRNVLPFSGPGYNGWPLLTLKPLLEILYRGQPPGERPVRATEHGVLLPTNSMLIVQALTSQRIPAMRQQSLAQCHRCAMTDCRYRAAPQLELV